jgi:hypothetical protein
LYRAILRDLERSRVGVGQPEVCIVRALLVANEICDGGAFPARERVLARPNASVIERVSRYAVLTSAERFDVYKAVAQDRAELIDEFERELTWWSRARHAVWRVGEQVVYAWTTKSAR